jgi:hypothetical protein
MSIHQTFATGKKVAEVMNKKQIKSKEIKIS